MCCKWKPLTISSLFLLQYWTEKTWAWYEEQAKGSSQETSFVQEALWLSRRLNLLNVFCNHHVPLVVVICFDITFLEGDRSRHAERGIYAALVYSWRQFCDYLVKRTNNKNVLYVDISSFVTGKRSHMILRFRKMWHEVVSIVLGKLICQQEAFSH